ncbi:hypothetical protein KC366_g14 [Hortaea werneckii]|nr:hypothetical protein KC366_g14 [Hortaea werneckii]
MTLLKIFKLLFLLSRCGSIIFASAEVVELRKFSSSSLTLRSKQSESSLAISRSRSVFFQLASSESQRSLLSMDTFSSCRGCSTSVQRFSRSSHAFENIAFNALYSAVTPEARNDCNLSLQSLPSIAGVLSCSTIDSGRYCVLMSSFWCLHLTGSLADIACSSSNSNAKRHHGFEGRESIHGCLCNICTFLGKRHYTVQNFRYGRCRKDDGAHLPRHLQRGANPDLTRFFECPRRWLAGGRKACKAGRRSSRASGATHSHQLSLKFCDKQSDCLRHAFTVQKELTHLGGVPSRRILLRACQKLLCLVKAVGKHQPIICSFGHNTDHSQTSEGEVICDSKRKSTSFDNRPSSSVEVPLSIMFNGFTDLYGRRKRHVFRQRM